MAKNKISEYSATPADNTDISNINIAEGCSPANVNNAIRSLMAQIKDLQAGTSGDTIPLTAGGTGSTTASAARTALGLAIGTDVQAYDADLTAWSSKTAPTGDAVGTTDTQTLTSKTLTNPTVTNYVESVVAIGTVTTSNTLSLTNGTVQTATLTASTACTFTMPTATAGKSFILLLKQAASTGNGTASFTGVKFGIAGTPTVTATAGKMDIFSFISDGTNWYGSAVQGYTL